MADFSRPLPCPRGARGSRSCAGGRQKRRDPAAPPAPLRSAPHGRSSAAALPAWEAPAARERPRTCGWGSIAPAETILLPSATWNVALFTTDTFGPQPAVYTCLSSPARAHSSSDGLGGRSSARLWSREGQMRNNRSQKGGLLQNLPFIPSNLFSPHLQFKLWLPCHRRLRIYLGRGPGAAARLSFQGSSPGKVTRG